MSISTFDTAVFRLVHIDAVFSPNMEALAESVAVWGIAVVPCCLAILWFVGNRSSRLTCVTAGMASVLSLMTGTTLGTPFRSSASCSGPS